MKPLKGFELAFDLYKSLIQNTGFNVNHPSALCDKYPIQIANVIGMADLYT